jgi:hypothetical protein
MKLISTLMNYVLLTTKKLSFDDSHGLMHSMETLEYANKIFENELPNNSRLIYDKNIIYASAILHDMVDRKYRDESLATLEIENLLNSETDMTKEEISITKNIINTMSYSKVKKQGYPNLGIYQSAYHIVREADLLCAYDFDRALIYDMAKNNNTFEESYENSHKLFIKRVFQYCNDNLFIHNFSKKEAYLLHDKSMKQIDNWRKIINLKKIY